MATFLSAQAVEPDGLRAVASDTNRPYAERLDALRRMAESRHPDAAAAIRAAAGAPESSMRSGALLLLVMVDGKDALPAALSAIRGGPASEQQAGMAALGALQSMSDDAERELDAWFTRLENDTAPANLRLDILLAARLSTVPAFTARVNALEAKLSAEEPFGLFRLSLEGGDALRGREIFFDHPAARCAHCHRAGGGIGPDLERVGERTNQAALLDSLLNPNARVTPGYAATSLRLRDGSSLVGVPTTETPDQLTLRLPDGELREIPRAQIAAQAPAESIMPSAGSVLSHAEIRDLVAHLASLRKDIMKSQQPAMPSPRSPDSFP